MEESGRLDHLEIAFYYVAEMDEFWNFVKKKENQRWTWYAMDKSSGIILSWYNGKRTDDALKKLLKQMENTPIAKYYTDDWGAYSRLINPLKHMVGKDETWKTERKNLNFRTRIKRLSRRTICYSKNELIHDNVIGTYIEHCYYKTGKFSNNDFNAFSP